MDSVPTGKYGECYVMSLRIMFGVIMTITWVPLPVDLLEKRLIFCHSSRSSIRRSTGRLLSSNALQKQAPITSQPPISSLHIPRSEPKRKNMV